MGIKDNYLSKFDIFNAEQLGGVHYPGQVPVRMYALVDSFYMGATRYQHQLGCTLSLRSSLE